MAMTITEAEIEAMATSLERTKERWYVNWIDGNEYTISTAEDYPDQQYYYNGRIIYSLGDYE